MVNPVALVAAQAAAVVIAGVVVTAAAAALCAPAVAAIPVTIAPSAAAPSAAATDFSLAILPTSSAKRSPLMGHPVGEEGYAVRTLELLGAWLDVSALNASFGVAGVVVEPPLR